MRNEYMSAYDSTPMGRNITAATTRCLSPRELPELLFDDVEQSEHDSIWYCTLDEVSQELGINREQVKKIEQQALKKCRSFCEARGWRLEDLLGP